MRQKNRVGDVLYIAQDGVVKHENWPADLSKPRHY